jgi:hypothetical protein
MKVVYRVHIDDPHTVTERQFVLEATPWPFPVLPAPGDVVAVNLPGFWRRLSGEGETAVSEYLPPAEFEATRVAHTIYFPGKDQAHIVFRGDGFGSDTASQ